MHMELFSSSDSPFGMFHTNKSDRRQHVVNCLQNTAVNEYGYADVRTSFCRSRKLSVFLVSVRYVCTAAVRLYYEVEDV